MPVSKTYKTRTRKIAKKAKKLNFKDKRIVIPFITVVVLVGLLIIWRSFAANFSGADTENWSISSTQTVAVRDDANASGGKYIEFLAPTVTASCPSGTTAMPLKTPEAQFKGKWPNSGNDYNDPVNGKYATGVPAGTCLKPSGSLDIRTPGQIVENLDVNGCIDINADNVTVRNVRIVANCPYVALHNFNSGTRFENIEVNCNLKAQDGVQFSYYSATRLNIYNCIGDGMKAGSNTTIEGTYIHDLVVSCDPKYGFPNNIAPPDFYDGGADCSHNDSVQVMEAAQGNLKFIKNNIIGQNPFGNAALWLSTDSGPITGVTIDGNRLSGGNAGLRSTNSTNVTVINNVFGPSKYGYTLEAVGFIKWDNNRIENPDGSIGSILPKP